MIVFGGGPLWAVGVNEIMRVEADGLELIRRGDTGSLGLVKPGRVLTRN